MPTDTVGAHSRKGQRFLQPCREMSRNVKICPEKNSEKVVFGASTCF
jgi:hypothetical protein